MPRGKLLIGTSGWDYKHWNTIFYPKDLPPKNKLIYFSKYFKTTEINYSFYHLPSPVTYKKWYNQTPKNFSFAVKASRFITHIKRLKGVEHAWAAFIESALNLKEKLGPILFQFPPSFKSTNKNIRRLEEFLRLIKKNNLLYAFEFRHESWCNDKIYRLLKENKSAWVISDSPLYPRVDITTADFVYIRMHGAKTMFSSKYTKEELKDLALKIKNWVKTLDVYVYFNNDMQGYAIENAQDLISLCKK